VSRRTLQAVVIACLAVGVVLMLAFDNTVTRVIGVTCLLAYVAGGLFLIADPSYLGGDD
jgi:uncharacterized membrane protein